MKSLNLAATLLQYLRQMRKTDKNAWRAVL